jgi:peptide/nickel transport system substrate-binding protein
VKSAPIGTGPFKYVKWTTGQSLQMARFPDFYLNGLPYLEGINFQRLGQPESLVPNLKSGAMDAVLLPNLSDVAALQSDSTYKVEVTEASGTMFDMVVNVKKPPLDNKQVRQALSYSLDRVGMAKSAFFGVAHPIGTPFYSPVSIAYREDLVMP